MSGKKFKLYHRLSEPASAEVRRLVKELGLLERLEFANIEIGERDIGELRAATGADRTPAIRVESGEWLLGRDAIFKYFGK